MLQVIVVVAVMACAGAACGVVWYLVREKPSKDAEVDDQWAPLDLTRVFERDKDKKNGKHG